LIVKAPELPGDELAISFEKCGRACGLVLVEGLTLWIGRRIARGTDVMQLEKLQRSGRNRRNSRYMCSPYANLGKPPLEAFAIQLRKARAEWRRRHPKT